MNEQMNCTGHMLGTSTADLITTDVAQITRGTPLDLEFATLSVSQRKIMSTNKLLSKPLSPKEIATRIGGMWCEIVMAEIGWVGDGRFVLYAPDLAMKVKNHLLKRPEATRPGPPDIERAQRQIKGLMEDRYVLDEYDDLPDTAYVALIQKYLKNCDVKQKARYLTYGATPPSPILYWFDGNECKAVYQS